MWSSLLSAGLSTGIDYGMQSVMSNSANAKNKRAQERQFYYNNLMLDKINEYNKPINQMARLEEAGLNPNIIYDKGADTLSATYGNVGMNGVTPTRMSSGFLDKMSMLNEMEQQKANIDRTNADTRAVNANLDISRAQLEMERQLNDARIKQINAETRLIDGRVDYRNPSTWGAALKYVNPIRTAERLGDVYHNLYDNVYGLLEAKYGKRQRH